MMAARRAAVVAAALLLALASATAAPAPASTASSSSALARASLNSGWSLANKNGSLSFSDVLLPNYPINELGKAGVIADPLYRYGELEVRWVTDDTWTYEKEFETPAGFGGKDANATDGPASVDLVLSGLDTYAFVELNGEQVLYADNFHREWRVPVKGLLKKAGSGEKNKLRITLPPATATALELKKKLPYLINTLSAPGAIDVYNFVRKPAYSFGWDWGTAIPATGIHGEIELVAHDRASVQGVHVVSQKRVASDNGTDGDVFSLDVEVLLSSPPQGDSGTVFAEVALPDGRRVTSQGDATLPASNDVVAGASRLADGGREFSARLKLDVPADAVELWWPAGYGKHPLYSLTVGFQPKGDDCAGHGEGPSFLQHPQPSTTDASLNGPSSTDPKIRAAMLSKRPYPAGGSCTVATRRVGFRTIELVEIPAKEAAANELRASWSTPEDMSAWPSWFRPDENWATIDGQWSYLGQSPLFWGPMYPTFGGYNFSYPPIGLTTPPMVSDPKAPGGKRPATWRDGDSEAFYFRVNGIPVYSKGSNIIPFSILPVNVTSALVDRTLDAAAATHQNTLRVWGGGYYQPDYFHDSLDERGMLGWLETPFACNVYPSHMPGFLENVRQEVRQNVRRLGGHASTALWGGNNEVEASFGWYTNTRANMPLYVSEYTALFIDTIGGVMGELAPVTPYLDSSPSSGWAQRPDKENGVVGVKRWAQAQDPRYGDAHYYNYPMDCEDWRSYPASKFISEFGWQSPPTFDTFAEASSKALGDWQFPDFAKTNQTLIEFRQRHQNGLNEMLEQIRRHFRVPKQWTVEGDAQASQQLFKDWFWLTSAQQAACYRTGVGAWRRFRSEPSSLTMGVLYWQMNDIWAGYSWSGYDWGGRWKPLNYAIKQQFAPLVVQVVPDNKSGNLDIFYVSDEVADVSDAKLEVTVRRVLGPATNSSGSSDCAANADAVAAQWTATVAINGSSAGLAWSKSIDDVLRAAPGCSRSNCYVTANLEASYPAVGVALAGGKIPKNAARDRTLSADGEAWLSYWKDAEPAPAAGLRASGFTQESEREVSFTVRAEGGATAPLVTLESPISGHFSDSGFTLHSGSKGCDGKRVVFTADSPITARELRDGLRLSSLAHHQSWDKLLSGGKKASDEVTAARPSL